MRNSHPRQLILIRRFRKSIRMRASIAPEKILYRIRPLLVTVEITLRLVQCFMPEQ
jgi:hypothetical protein